jgi:hypothetical protein
MDDIKRDIKFVQHPGKADQKINRRREIFLIDWAFPSQARRYWYFLSHSFLLILWATYIPSRLYLILEETVKWIRHSSKNQWVFPIGNPWGPNEETICHHHHHHPIHDHLLQFTRATQREQKSSSVGFPILSHSFAHGGGSPSVSGNSANPLSQPTVSGLNCSIEIARSLEVKEWILAYSRNSLPSVHSSLHVKQFLFESTQSNWYHYLLDISYHSLIRVKWLDIFLSWLMMNAQASRPLLHWLCLYSLWFADLKLALLR